MTLIERLGSKNNNGNKRSRNNSGSNRLKRNKERTKTINRKKRNSRVPRVPLNAVDIRKLGHHWQLSPVIPTPWRRLSHDSPV